MSEDNGDSFNLSRRKALAGLGSIGAATIIGGAATYAQFTDTEETWAQFTAGAIDGRVIGGASYNGSSIQDLDASNFGPQADGIGLEVTLGDIKPGDFGCFSFGIEVENNPAYVASCLGYTDSTDGTVFEPEVHEDDDVSSSDIGAQSSTDGEIPENMLVLPFYKGANHPASEWNPCQFFDVEDEEFGIEQYEGSGAVGTPTAFWDNSENGLSPHLLSDAVGIGSVDTMNWDDDFVAQECEYEGAPEVGDGCIFLNGAETSTQNQQEAAPLEPGDRIYFGYDWHVPFDTGNEMQGDTMTLQLGFNFSQVRHTENQTLQNIYAPGQNLPDDS